MSRNAIIAVVVTLMSVAVAALLWSGRDGDDAPRGGDAGSRRSGGVDEGSEGGDGPSAIRTADPSGDPADETEPGRAAVARPPADAGQGVAIPSIDVAEEPVDLSEPGTQAMMARADSTLRTARRRLIELRGQLAGTSGDERDEIEAEIARIEGVVAQTERDVARLTGVPLDE